MGRHDDNNSDDVESSCSSSSLDNDGDDDNHRERKRTSSKKHKKRKRHENSSKKKKKKSKKQHHSRRREHADSSDDHASEGAGRSSSRSSSGSDGSDNEEERKKKRHKMDSNKRHCRKEKDTHKKSSREEEKKSSSSKKNRHESSKRRRRDDDDHSDNDNGDRNSDAFARNHALANALLQLLDSHPALVADLPIMLIRLASGTTFDLSQMTDPTASHGIAAVFQCLEPYGVLQETITGAWMWKGPRQHGGTNNDLVLVRVVRALLDQIGITIGAVEAFESDEVKRIQEAATTLKATPTTTTITNAPATSAAAAAASSGSSSGQKADPIVGQVQQMLSNFGDENAGLGKELAVLCNMILEGESVALDGLPDERLRKALESLFASCGLEKCEMENDSEQDGDDDDKDGGDVETEKAMLSMGYGLPENDAGNPKETTARVRLESILTACQQEQQTQSSNGARRRVLGPSLPPAGYEQDEEESDEEGPQLTTAGDATAAHRRPETADMVLAQAARRARELRAVNAGLSIKDVAAIEDGGGREEWMIVPGQYDFLDCIKSAPIRNRTFQGGSKHDKDKQQQQHEGPIDKTVQAEMNAILQAHQDSRGPSLFEEHRAAKAAAEAEKKKSGKSNNWKWSRDRDLDEGRRVDKDALNMVMGGAATGLQSKFQGGFGR